MWVIVSAVWLAATVLSVQPRAAVATHAVKHCQASPRQCLFTATSHTLSCAANPRSQMHVLQMCRSSGKSSRNSTVEDVLLRSTSGQNHSLYALFQKPPWVTSPLRRTITQQSTDLQPLPQADIILTQFVSSRFICWFSFVQLKSCGRLSCGNIGNITHHWFSVTQHHIRPHEDSTFSKIEKYIIWDTFLTDTSFGAKM